VSKTLANEFQALINRKLPQIIGLIPTPFFLYTEDGIREACGQLKHAFREIPGYRNYYVVKANNNPTILEIVSSEGFGFDCSSASEITLALRAGAKGEDVFFSSNNTSREEFGLAFSNKTLFNYDDISLIEKAPAIPAIACCRYNPGPLVRTDGQFVGKPEEAKYGLTVQQVIDFFRIMKDKGVKRFALHCMICSNERDHNNLVMTAKMMLETVEWISRTLGIVFEAINIGGGFGIPYNPETDPTLDIHRLGVEITGLFLSFKNRNGWMPKLVTENGRFIAGHSGVLVTEVINTKSTYQEYLGVDAQTFSSVPRPFIYDAHHEISVIGKENAGKDHIYTVVGSLCENADRFATKRAMPKTILGDILLVHNAGAHCYAMSGNYNGRTRPAEVMIFSDESFGIIRRAQTEEDLFREMISADTVKRIRVP
jgi:diaminopimelate decarboxylase